MSEPCTQKENIQRLLDAESHKSEVMGALIEATNSVKESILRLDKRINGTFNIIGEHIKESPFYRGKIETLETEIKNIKEEKLNTIKNSQWRIGIIVGVLCTAAHFLGNLLCK